MPICSGSAQRGMWLAQWLPWVRQEAARTPTLGLPHALASVRGAAGLVAAAPVPHDYWQAVAQGWAGRTQGGPPAIEVVPGPAIGGRVSYMELVLCVAWHSARHPPSLPSVGLATRGAGAGAEARTGQAAAAFAAAAAAVGLHCMALEVSGAIGDMCFAAWDDMQVHMQCLLVHLRGECSHCPWWGGSHSWQPICLARCMVLQWCSHMPSRATVAGSMPTSRNTSWSACKSTSLGKGGMAHNPSRHKLPHRC